MAFKFNKEFWVITILYWPLFGVVVAFLHLCYTAPVQTSMIHLTASDDPSVRAMIKPKDGKLTLVLEGVEHPIRNIEVKNRHYTSHGVYIETDDGLTFDVDRSWMVVNDFPGAED